MGTEIQNAEQTETFIPPPRIISGLQFHLHRLKILRQALKLAYNSYPTLADARAALRGLRAVIRENDRIRHIRKAVLVEGRFFPLMSFPGGVSPAHDVFILNVLHKAVPIPGRTQGLLLMILAMTKKCSLQCEHCFEWDQLNGKEQLTVADLLHIIKKFQDRGVAQIELSGGEPLNRFDDLLEILQKSDTAASDFWILSSGYRLTAEKAQLLKNVGLTGVSISLDHWDAAEHDRFRGLKGSFEWAAAAVRHARAAGMVTGLSLTPVKSFCTPEDLFKFAELARSWGVHFIRILEPRAVGHFEGQDVELNTSELAVIESFARTMQLDARYRQYPIIDYYGTYQRAVGCSGAGERYLYVDTEGDYHACPFCRNKCGSAVHNSIEEGMKAMQAACGCHAFKTV